MVRETKQQLIDRLIYEARAHQAANIALDEVAYDKLGINSTDGRCLDIVQNEGPMTAGRLAELSGLTTAAVTQVLDRLERAGYARRVRDEKDRRRVNVELASGLAERGRQIWGPLGEEAQAEFMRMSVNDLKAATEVLRRGRELNERHIERVRHLRFD